MLFVEKSVCRAPYWVLWESKNLAFLQQVSASKNSLYRVWHSTVWGQFVLALAPGAPSLCRRTQGKSSNGHSGTPVWGRRGTTRAHANFCSWRIFTMLYGLYFVSAVVHEKPKSSFFSQVSQSEWRFASGITELGPQDLACQPRAKVQAEILIRIAQELHLKKQPHNETDNFSATKYSS